MSARLRGRVERLENARPAGRATLWNLLCGDPIDPADLEPELAELVRTLPDGPVPDEIEEAIRLLTERPSDAGSNDIGGRVAGATRPPNGLRELPPR